MYHVHPNKRTQHSARRIADVLQKLMDQKSFDQITISDLQKTSGIARSTFYRSFDNLIDVLEWRCDNEFDQLFRRFGKQPQFPSESVVLKAYLDYWTRHSTILTDLISIHRTDIIYRCQEKYAEQMVVEYGPLIEFSPIDRKYFLSVRVGFVLGIILQWVRTGRQETVSQLQAAAQRQLQYLSKTFQ